MKEKIIDNVRTTLTALGKNKSKLNLKDLQAYDRMVKDADIAVKKLEDEIEEKRKIMQEHIDKYAALKRERRVVEILKEKAYKRYEEESSKDEQKLIDEIGKDQFVRNKENRITSDN
jgi:flagellar export protein FliJ